ncbi:MAG: hypothetical protein AB8H47_19380 [Bacteroidia bacterium]
MTDQSFEFWRKWLIGANVMTIGVGLIAAFAGNSIFFELHNTYTQELFFQGQAISGDMLALKNWLFGIIGGTIVGYHILMIFITVYPFKERQRWSWVALWTGLLSWFVIDSGISSFYGAYYNVYLINLVALVLIGLPLLMTRKEFSISNSQHPR